MCAWSHFSCVQICYLMGCSPPGSSVCGILQARTLEWIVISSSSGSSWTRDETQISYVSCIGRQVLYHKCLLGSFHQPDFQCHQLAHLFPSLTWILTAIWAASESNKHIRCHSLACLASAQGFNLQGREGPPAIFWSSFLSSISYFTSELVPAAVPLSSASLERRTGLLSGSCVESCSGRKVQICHCQIWLPLDSRRHGNEAEGGWTDMRLNPSSYTDYSPQPKPHSVGFMRTCTSLLLNKHLSTCYEPGPIPARGDPCKPCLPELTNPSADLRSPWVHHPYLYTYHLYLTIYLSGLPWQPRQ